MFERKGVRMQSTVENSILTIRVEGAEPVDIVPLDAPPELVVEVLEGKGFRIEAPLDTLGRHVLVIPGQYPWTAPDS